MVLIPTFIGGTFLMIDLHINFFVTCDNFATTLREDWSHIISWKYWNIKLQSYEQLQFMCKNHCKSLPSTKLGVTFFLLFWIDNGVTQRAGLRTWVSALFWLGPNLNLVCLFRQHKEVGSKFSFNLHTLAIKTFSTQPHQCPQTDAKTNLFQFLTTTTGHVFSSMNWVCKLLQL